MRRIAILICMSMLSAQLDPSAEVLRLPSSSQTLINQEAISPAVHWVLSPFASKLSAVVHKSIALARRDLGIWPPIGLILSYAGTAVVAGFWYGHWRDGFDAAPIWLVYPAAIAASLFILQRIAFNISAGKTTRRRVWPAWIIAVGLVAWSAARKIEHTSIYEMTSQILAEPQESHAPVSFSADDGTSLRGWFIPPKEFHNPQDQQVLLMLQGQGGIMSEDDIRERITLLHAHLPNTAIFVIDYRQSTGGFQSERNVASDARGALAHLISQGFSKEHIVVYGISLGSYPAILLMGQVRAGILEAPFTNMMDMAITEENGSTWGHIESRLVQDQFNNEKNIKQVRPNQPLLIFTAPGRVPQEQGQRLGKMKGGSTVVVYLPNGDHDTAFKSPNFIPSIQDFLAGQADPDRARLVPLEKPFQRLN